MIASAPGKVFVTGEYAVVQGGPAVLATVSRRLRSRVRARRGRGEVLLRCGGPPVRCDLSAERVDDVPAHARFVACAALVAARALEVRAVDLEIETETELDRATGKTGLGGSAAATAATVAALHGLFGPATAGDDDLARRVAAGVFSHRLAQGGGSAADVVACTVGGLVWVEGLDARDVPGGVGECAARVRAAFTARGAHRVALPPGLALEVVATGRACATAPRAARFAGLASGARGGIAEATVRAWCAGMAAAAELLRDACTRGDAAAALQAIRAAAALLSRLGAAAAIPVYTPELRRAVASVAGERDAAVKPSGAGGGDCAVALVARSSRERLRAAWRACGLEPLDVSVTDDGARCEAAS